MDTKIFVMTHKEYNSPDKEEYISLQVGRKLSKDLGYLSDDSGDSISEKNKSFCELTGVYWLWKNYSCDYIGICHYRRFFLKDGRLLSKEYIEETLKDYDVIMPYSGGTQYPTVYDDYASKHIASDMDVCRDIISRRYPEYLEAFELNMSGKFISVGNMLITSKKIFDEYCSWLFDILFEAEKIIDISDRDDYQKRVFGFLSERLLRVWLVRNSYRVKEEEVLMADAADLNREEKKTELIKKIVGLICSNVCKKYSCLTEVGYSGDEVLKSDERTPVWLCRWDTDNVSDISEICFQSVYKQFESDDYDVRLITFDNYGEYITFSENVINKFNAGKIPVSHLSEIAMAQLLLRYGGIYIDTCMFIRDNRIAHILKNKSFYTLKTAKTQCDIDVSLGRWNSGLIKAQAGSVFCAVLYESLENYWISQDNLIADNLIDYIIDNAVENVPYIKELADSVDVNNTNAFELDLRLDRLFRKDELARLSEDTSVFFLNPYVEHKKNNIVGTPTFYGKILSGRE